MGDLSKEFKVYLDNQDYEVNGSDDEEGLNRDDLFQLLQSSRRRAVVRYISGFDPPYSKGEVAKAIACIENQKPPSQISSNERQTVYINLHQVHLPKLDEFSIIDYRERSGEFERGENFTVMDSFVLDEFNDNGERVEVSETPLWQKVFSGIL